MAMPGTLPFDHSHLRSYRWGEDGLLGLTDEHCLLCFAPALWNGQDPILKERLFGLGNPEGNHGEDIKDTMYHRPEHNRQLLQGALSLPAAGFSLSTAA